jgi:peptidyl-prolyl cis-trans isomerase C
MVSFKRVAPPALAALLMVALPALPALAADAAAKPAVNEQAKEQPKASSSDVVERVNGTAITKVELERAIKVMMAQNQIQQPLAPEVMKEAQAAALEQLESAELLYQEAGKLPVKDLDKQLAEKMAENRSKFKTEADLDKALQSVGMTRKDLEDFARKDIVINNFVESRFVAKATATDAEAQKFYNDNVDKFFSQPESVRASHILIGADEKVSPEDRKKAKEKAEAILKRVKAGEDFAAIAKAESTCPSSAQGGDLGSFGHGQMVPPFEKAAFALKTGEISGVVETNFGYHIIKLTEKHEAAKEKFEDVKEKIVEFLKRQKVQQELSDLIVSLKKGAKIEKL